MVGDVISGCVVGLCVSGDAVGHCVGVGGDVGVAVMIGGGVGGIVGLCAIVMLWLRHTSLFLLLTPLSDLLVLDLEEKSTCWTC